MADIRHYAVDSGFQLPALTEILLFELKENRKLEAQVFTDKNASIIQARETSDLKKLSGMNLAITIKIDLNEGHLKVEIGQGKWLDKVGGTTAALFLFAPLLITTAIGTYKQVKLPMQLFSIIEQYAASSNVTPQIPLADILCPYCGEKSSGNIFCSKCGKKLTASCPSCGAELQLNERFCRKCGTPRNG